MELTVTPIWEGSLETELTALLQTTVNPALEKGLRLVGEDMRYDLAKHIQRDVYDQYSPVEYQRRGDSGIKAQALDAKIYSDGAHVTLDFKPNGSHPDEGAWAERNVRVVNGDELIGRIEKNSPAYTWPPVKESAKRRPFWQNFVNEMVDGNVLETYFIAEMRELLPPDMKLETDGGTVERESGDGEY